MSQVVDRFLQYVSFDTQSEEGAAKQPSTDKQWELARLLKQELEELGAEQVRLSEYGYIYAEKPIFSAIIWSALRHFSWSPSNSSKKLA